ncbi:isoprenylcysteine carboxyl methyltransferase family protein [Brevibacillus choshinensis]|uniref:isoprenylcysteine carboxyl methyltransferase family protein n=1 Tax=Brevibacillus choshinensis TaxID=54911 RepID=UPI002E208914|nr:isoprenylcysteine carboxylmethyltransferase family protein [Brevibacillus choshinensis]MED4780621.1 isoprenylcysteine carboxylmethyltransferase family protein [Brevibacillus choshinensis]
MIFFWIVLGILLLQRVGELFLAARNARIIRSLGGYEIGAGHYLYIVALHTLFFISLILEAQPSSLPRWWLLSFAFFLAAQILRYWCIWSLGNRWNTRIMILPDSLPIIRGPYRFIRHPNYLVVAIELFALPMTFGASLTAFSFTLLNAWLLLRIRIPMEESAVYQTKE